MSTTSSQPSATFTQMFFFSVKVTVGVGALALPQQVAAVGYVWSAVMLFLLNLIGLGCGPVFVGMVSDHLEPRYGTAALGHSLNWLAPFMVLAFLLQCATALSVMRDRRRGKLML